MTELVPGGRSDQRLCLINTTWQFAAAVWRHRGLVHELLVRDLKGGHAGHGLGSLWLYLQPLVILTSFMMIFGIVIGSKIAVSANFPGDYTSYMLIGVAPWLLMANALGRAPSVYIANSSIVKQVVFPIETLPVATILAAFVTFAPAFAVTVLYKLILGGGLGWLSLILPLVIAMHFVLTLGLTLLLSVTTPFLRDIREIVTMYLAVAMYFTPAAYLPDWVPEALRPVLYMNPFSYVVWVYQDALFFGEIRHGFAWIVFGLMAAISLIVGLHVFQRVKPFLGNVL